MIVHSVDVQQVGLQVVVGLRTSGHNVYAGRVGAAPW